jgi:hypothetical protein
VKAELGPGNDFEQLFEGSVAAGKDEEGVGELGHAGLALVHGFDELEAREAAVSDLAVGEDVGQNADDGCSGGKGGVGDCAHETDFGSAVDESESCGSDSLAEGYCFSPESGDVAVGGSTINGDAAGRRVRLAHGEIKHSAER